MKIATPITKYSVLFATLLAASRCLTSSGLAHIKAADIRFSSLRLADYYDQQELPVPRSAGLEELIGRTPADQASAIISPNEPSERPHRPLLRVEFLSAVDFQAIANRDAIIFLHSYFCSHQHDFAVLSAPTVYRDGKPIRTDSTGRPAAFIPGPSVTYYVYLNAVRKENRNSRPPQIGFDLRETLEDVCFHVTGSGALGLIYKSSTVVVPKEAIAAAIDQHASN